MLSAPIPLFGIPEALQQCEVEGIEPAFIIAAGAMPPGGGGIALPNQRPVPACFIVSKSKGTHKIEVEENAAPSIVKPA